MGRRCVSQKYCALPLTLGRRRHKMMMMMVLLDVGPLSFRAIILPLCLRWTT